MSNVGSGKVKVARMYLTRTVEQSAEVTIELEPDDYEKLKSGKLKWQDFVDNAFDEDEGWLSNDNVAWLNTDEGDITIEAGETGAFHADE